MRLRPATPLSFALFVAFVLLLLATISTPILKIIPLAKVNGVTLGVFGYCAPQPKGCTSIQIGYQVGTLLYLTVSAHRFVLCESYLLLN